MRKRLPGLLVNSYGFAYLGIATWLSVVIAPVVVKMCGEKGPMPRSNTN